jgi:predicted Zn finger-like uncharacterized protein
MAQPLKVTCPSCSSKFHIPLHLVRGKVVSFRCKKCKGTIPVDGRAISTATPQPLPAPHVTPPEGWMGQRPSSPPPEGAEPRTPMYSEPPSMRLSISDGLVVHGNGSNAGMPSTTGLQVDTPAAFTHSNSPSQRPAVPGASRTPPWGLGAPSIASAPPPPISRTEPPDAMRLSDPPPSFRGSSGRGKKVAGAFALVTAVGLSLWSLGVSHTPAPAAQIDRPAAAAPETKPAAEPARAAAAPTPTVEAVKPSTPVAAPMKEPEPAPTKPARAAKGRAAKPAPAEAPAEVAQPAEEPAPAAPLSPAAAAAQEATNAAAQEKEIDFNKEAARQALEDAMQRAAACRTIDTPAGAARVAVTFSPAGSVTAAVIESGPLVGTSAGGCVASKFRTVRVPTFTGEPVTVHKTVTF